MPYSNIWIHVLEALTITLIALAVFRIAKQYLLERKDTQIQKTSSHEGILHDEDVLHNEDALNDTFVKISTKSTSGSNPASSAQPAIKKESAEHTKVLNDYIGDFF